MGSVHLGLRKLALACYSSIDKLVRFYPGQLASGMRFYSILHTVEILREIVSTLTFSFGLLSIAIPSWRLDCKDLCTNLIAINMRDPFRHLASFTFCFNNNTEYCLTCAILGRTVSMLSIGFVECSPSAWSGSINFTHFIILFNCILNHGHTGVYMVVLVLEKTCLLNFHPTL